MLKVEEVINYYKAGKGKIMQCFISDEELEDIFLNSLLKEYKPYEFVISVWDGKETFCHKSYPIHCFIELRRQGIERFFLRSYQLTPELNVPSRSIIGGELNNLYQKYYLYNGLIDIQHGFLIEKKYFSETSISMIDKFFLIGKPQYIFTNRDYGMIYKQIEKRAIKFMKYRSKATLLNGKLETAKKLNVSENFANKIKEGLISSNITFE